MTDPVHDARFRTPHAANRWCRTCPSLSPKGNCPGPQMAFRNLNVEPLCHEAAIAEAQP